MIIAIDGPAGSGKSTIAQMLAQRLNLFYLDTGAIYRALTWKVLMQETDPNDAEEVQKVLAETQIELQPFKGEKTKLKVLVDSQDVTEEIRKPLVGRAVSLVSAHPLIRQRLIPLQRKLAEKGAVVEGRDVTTVVFPHADLKIFLDASQEVRIERRLKDWKKRGIKGTPDQAALDILERDALDSSRSHSPLKRAKDALVIDTTHLTPQEVVEKIVSSLREKGG
jgi:cytidylate kinase